MITVQETANEIMQLHSSARYITSSIFNLFDVVVVWECNHSSRDPGSSVGDVHHDCCFYSCCDCWFVVAFPSGEARRSYFPSLYGWSLPVRFVALINYYAVNFATKNRFYHADPKSTPCPCSWQVLQAIKPGYCCKDLRLNGKVKRVLRFLYVQHCHFQGIPFLNVRNALIKVIKNKKIRGVLEVWGFLTPLSLRTIISSIPRRPIGNFLSLSLFFFHVKKKFNSKSDSKYNLNSESKQQRR